MLNGIDWQSTLYSLPGILFGLTVHEYCHALCALKLGDTTARDQGRVTLNPLKHIDIFGFIFIIIAGFGWAKPVLFDPERLRNYRRDKALIASAGPLSNMILGLILVFCVKGLLFLFDNDGISLSLFALARHIYFILFYAAFINFGLFIFNLLPIPPLDGSHIVFSGLNLKPEVEEKIRKIGMPLLIIIILVQNNTKISILPIGNIVMAIMDFFLPT